MAITTSSEFYYRQWKRQSEPFYPKLPDRKKVFSLRKDIHSLKDLRVAAVLDPFSVFSYEPECKLLNLDGENYLEELQEFRPDVFFFESAWQGKDDAWRFEVRYPTPKFQQVIAWCKAHRVPVVFWNKEDPVHTDQFKKTAAQADFVFTTEADLIPRYKAWLGHDSVYHLHFAAQPVQHNPIETYDRKDKVCFAGAWYQRFPYRNLILSHFIDMLETRNGMDIYDRNYEVEDTLNKFPPEYSRYILGTLPPEEIDVAYKGYLYGLNMCSVTQSGTMFARRTFELGASNTLILSNYAYGLKRYFGDLLISTDDMEEAAQKFDTLYTGTNARRMRLLMLRKVLREHLYEDRLDRIVSVVFGVHLKRRLPDVYIVDTSTDVESRETVQKSFDAQTYAARHLIRPEEIGLVPDGAFVGIFSPRDHYGENYLTDLMLSLRYSALEGYVKPEAPSEAYRPTETAYLRRAVVRMDVLRAQNCVFEEDAPVRGQFLCVDEFNYQPGHAKDWTEDLDDIRVDDHGASLEEIEAEKPHKAEWQRFSPKEIFAVASCSDNETVHTELTEQSVRIENLAEKGVAYKWVTVLLKREDYSALNNGLEIRFDMETLEGPEVVGACVFRTDGVPADLGPAFMRGNEPGRSYIPPKCIAFRLMLRLEHGSVVQISGISIRRAFHPLWFQRMGQSDTMILTNIYPQYDNLYRNMFVHERVRQYREQGHSVQVFCLNDRAQEQIWQFEGQDVFSVHSDGLDLALGRVKTVCVHFLTADMWKVLKNHLDHIRLIVWLHGSEIQPYTRRLFLYKGKVPQDAIRASDARKKLWKEVFARADAGDADIRFVCVSKYFAGEIAEDNNLDPVYIERHFIIIHNNVDEDCFRYREKTAEHRLHLLSIRPYASTKYANDLTAKCIEELAARPFFEELHFSIYGDGVLFDDVTAPLTKFENVSIEKRLLTHEEIARVYEHHGILIVPTRMDAQGVSRDEGMHAGLVPVTTAVTAIPEFCDESCAILVPGEDYKAMADGIERLYRDPELFLRMSKAAAETSQRNTGFAATIQKEIDLIFP